jgi:hypothetical protein
MIVDYILGPQWGGLLCCLFSSVQQLASVIVSPSICLSSQASQTWSATSSPITLAAESNQEPRHIGLPVIDSAYFQQASNVGRKLLVC